MSNFPSEAFDRWLTTDPRDDGEDEAFEAWAIVNLPDLNWDDDDAVDAAWWGPWQSYKDDIQDAAEREIGEMEW